MTYALILDANYIFSVSLLYPTYHNLLFINLRLPFESMFTQAYDDEWESKYSVKRGFLAGSDVVAKSFVFFPKVQLSTIIKPRCSWCHSWSNEGWCPNFWFFIVKVNFLFWKADLHFKVPLPMRLLFVASCIQKHSNEPYRTAKMALKVKVNKAFFFSSDFLSFCYLRSIMEESTSWESVTRFWGLCWQETVVATTRVVSEASSSS